MATNQPIKGNPADFVWALLDKDGAALPDLAAATEITFELRRADQLGTSPTPELSLTLTADPTKVLIDNPATGSVTVEAASTDMAIAAGLYDAFLQVVITAARTLEYQQLRSVQVLAEGIA